MWKMEELPCKKIANPDLIRILWKFEQLESLFEQLEYLKLHFSAPRTQIEKCAFLGLWSNSPGDVLMVWNSRQIDKRGVLGL